MLTQDNIRLMQDDYSDEACPGVAAARAVSITSLPFELLVSILWNDQLTRHDVEAVRLSCRALAPAAASRLFFRIYISKLVSDRDTFLAICNSPHLAQHVREVEWLEISHALGDFDDARKKFDADARTLFDEDDKMQIADVCRYLETTSKHLFWLFNAPVDLRDANDGAIEAARRDTVAVFRPVFESAVDKLPSLHTFISRPMTSDRVISDLQYPITAWRFQCFKDTTRSPPRLQTNDGLFLFLLPAMGRPTSTVTRLRWLDECPGFSYLRPFPDSTFKNLESLEMSVNQCWGERRDLGSDPLAGLEAAFTSAAPTLRHFKLTLDDACTFERFRDAHLGGIILGWLSSRQFALRSLSLSSMGLSTSALLKFIQAHAASLSHLTLEDVPVFSKLIKNMAQLPGLQLESIQLLHYEELLYSEGSWYKYPGDSEDEDDESSWQDEDSSSDGISSTGKDSLIKKEIVTERALLRYLRGEKPVCDSDQRAYDVVLAGDSVLITTSQTNDIEANRIADCASETSSEDSVEYRRRTAPRWAWGRYFYEPNSSEQGRVFAFQVPETSSRGHATTRWRFTSRDGEVGYGDDPLAWFDDWDLEAGDKEEPLPYCKALRDFVVAHQKHLDLGKFLGEASEAWQFLRHLSPPAGAFAYDEPEDLYSLEQATWCY